MAKLRLRPFFDLGNEDGWQNLLYFILFLAAIYFPIFLHLDAHVIRIYDEARNAMNAIYMAENHNYLIRYIGDLPDDWETKPPLLVWLQLICLKTFGYNELAIRLPSAVSAVFTILILTSTVIKISGKPLMGYLCGLVLATSPGYLFDHSVRYGEHEGLLIFCVTSSVLCFFRFMEEPDRKKWLYLCTIAICGAALTKGIQGLTVLPALLIYALYLKKFIPLLKRSVLYVNILIFILLVGGYYFLRELKQPGYLLQMTHNELFRILPEKRMDFSDTNGGFLDYWKSMSVDGRFIPWLYFVPIGVLISLFHYSQALKRLAVFAIIMFVEHFLVISNSAIKTWYQYPAYPMMALVTGLGLYLLLEGVVKLSETWNEWRRTGAILFFFLAVFIGPYSSAFTKAGSTDDGWQGYRYGYYIRQLESEKPQFRNYDILMGDYNQHVEFYAKILKINKGYNIKMSWVNDETPVGDTVMVSEDYIHESIQKRYEVQLVDESQFGKLYKLIKRK